MASLAAQRKKTRDYIGLHQEILKLPDNRRHFPPSKLSFGVIRLTDLSQNPTRTPCWIELPSPPEQNALSLPGKHSKRPALELLIPRVVYEYEALDGSAELTILLGNVDVNGLVETHDGDLLLAPPIRRSIPNSSDSRGFG